MNRTPRPSLPSLHAVLICNGAPPSPQLFLDTITDQSIVVGVDGGSTVALTYGVVPNVVIGDLDSLSTSTRAELEGTGTIFITHPQEKDSTDLELALLHVRDLKVESVTVLGATGGETDHFFTNALLLTDERYRSLNVTIEDERYLICPLRSGSPFHISGELSGQVFSIIPLSDEVRGVDIVGAKWPLSGATLKRGRSHTSRNEVMETGVTVSIQSGAAIVITHKPR